MLLLVVSVSVDVVMNCWYIPVNFVGAISYQSHIEQDSAAKKVR